MLIKNGFLIDPASDTERLVDLRITDGLIQTLADAGTLTPENGEDELDAAGLMISPGLVDTHIHFRDPGFTYKEDLHTGSLAAAAGGFTSVICMANTSPVIDSVPVLKELMEREALEDIHIFQAAAVSCGLKGEEMTSMKELAAAGDHEIFPGKTRHTGTDFLPFTGRAEIGTGLLYFLRLHAIGKVSAVAFVPALGDSILGQANISLYDLNIQNTHFYHVSFLR